MIKKIVIVILVFLVVTLEGMQEEGDQLLKNARILYEKKGFEQYKKFDAILQNSSIVEALGFAPSSVDNRIGILRLGTRSPLENKVRGEDFLMRVIENKVYLMHYPHANMHLSLAEKIRCYELYLAVLNGELQQCEQMINNEALQEARYPICNYLVYQLHNADGSPHIVKDNEWADLRGKKIVKSYIVPTEPHCLTSTIFRDIGLASLNIFLVDELDTAYPDLFPKQMKGRIPELAKRVQDEAMQIHATQTQSENQFFRFIVEGPSAFEECKQKPDFTKNTIISPSRTNKLYGFQIYTLINNNNVTFYDISGKYSSSDGMPFDMLAELYANLILFDRTKGNDLLIHFETYFANFPMLRMAIFNAVTFHIFFNWTFRDMPVFSDNILKYTQIIANEFAQHIRSHERYLASIIHTFHNRSLISQAWAQATKKLYVILVENAETKIWLEAFFESPLVKESLQSDFDICTRYRGRKKAVHEYFHTLFTKNPDSFPFMNELISYIISFLDVNESFDMHIMKRTRNAVDVASMDVVS